VSARHYLSLLGWAAATVAAVAAGAQVRLLAAVIAFAFVGALLVLTTLWLPRSAHAAFEAARYRRAARRYWLCGVLTWSPARDRAARLSRAGCAIAGGRVEAAERLLARLDPASLDTGERAVWLNNRAYAQLAAGGDARDALVLAEQAGALRPDVAGIQHTRALALLGVGRTDDALHVLDNMRAGGELSPRLEAARCRELAAAWDKKGETAYADDYRRRAEVLAG
jgi:thioredoxin-like negative regulator of GroEL